MRTATLAAILRTEAEAREISLIARAMTAAFAKGDSAELSRCDVAFHKAVANASHNALFIQIFDSFGLLIDVAVPMAWRTRTTKQEQKKAVEHHVALAKAIAYRDPDGAAQAMGGHFAKPVSDIFAAMTRFEPV
jgi:DNA-binding FadR family transcriptional regulator